MLILNKRNDELVMLVLQDNSAKKLRLIAADELMLKTAGLSDDAENVDFLALLAKKQRLHIAEELQYMADEKDLSEIMLHMSQLNFHGLDDDFSFRVVREVPQGRNDVFRIILMQSSKTQKKYEMLEALQQNMAGHVVLDKASGLPVEASILQFVELAKNYTEIETAYVHVEITPKNEQLQQVIGLAIRRNVRQEDMVGLIGAQEISILLTDVDIKSAHLAINRLRTTLACDPLLSQKRISYALRFGGVAINNGRAAAEIADLAKNILANDASKDIIFTA